MRNTLALAFALAATAASAEEPVVTGLNVEVCTYVYWKLIGGETEEWVCPNGVKYVMRLNWLSSSSIVRAEKDDGRCVYEETEKLWLCPPGFVIKRDETTKVRPGS